MSNVNLRRAPSLPPQGSLRRPRSRLSAADADRLRVGFIGVGNRGTALLRNFLDAKLGDVVAVCDIKEEHAKRAATLITGTGQKEPTLIEDWKKLLEVKDIHAVVAALPCDLHAALYLDVIAAGKDLYGEKPMCLTPADCDKVVKAANASKQIVQIGFQRRADPRFIEPMKLIHEGELGDLVEGRILWSNSWGSAGRTGSGSAPGAVTGWWSKPATTGMSSTGPARAFRCVRWVLSAVPVSTKRSRNRPRRLTDYYSAVVEYENGAIINILHSWVAPGQNGKFTKEFNDEYTRLNGVKAGIDFNSGVIAYRKELNLPDKVAHSAQGNINNTKLGLEAFAASVKNRKPPVATVEHGRDAVLACLLVREVVYQKKPITMKELRG